MYIKSLKTQHFRNYTENSIEFHPSVNVFVGENAQGKTNMLEAIYVLAMAKSHRTAHVKELIQWGEEYARIEGRVQKKNDSFPLELTLFNKGKRAKANHNERKRLSDYLGMCNVVLFAPEDLRLVKDSPSHRRRFIDMEIGQIQPVYIHKLSEYQTVLQQRNALLKRMGRQPEASRPMLEILTEQMIDLAADILKRRLYFVTMLQEWAKPLHESISNHLEELTINYVPAAIEVSEDIDMSKMKLEYEKAFEELGPREIDRGTTLFGPHRDDMRFIVNGRDIQTYGSQGQQRTTALSLKLAEIELIKKETGEYPILLLDDVLSELDDARQTHLLSTFQERVQTIITTTNVSAIDKNTLDKAKVYQVKAGQISRGVD